MTYNPEELFQGPEMTPEERINERIRLSNIDTENSRKTAAAFAREALKDATENDFIDEARAGLRHHAQLAAAEIIAEHDPEFEQAKVFKIEVIEEYEGHFMFMKQLKERRVLKDLAMWLLNRGAIEGYATLLLGRDGTLYGLSESPTTSSAFEPIAIDELSFEQILQLEKALTTTVDTIKLIQNQ